MTSLRPDDLNLIDKLKAVPPDDITGALKQVLEWKPDEIQQAVIEWLNLSARHAAMPENMQIAMAFDRATERLSWMVHREPVTGKTPYRLALTALGHARGSKRGGEADKHKKWALALADHLRDQSKQSAIKALENGVKFSVGGEPCRAYSECGTIYCDDLDFGKEIGKLKLVSFFDPRRYFGKHLRSK